MLLLRRDIFIIYYKFYNNTLSRKISEHIFRANYIVTSCPLGKRVGAHEVQEGVRTDRDKGIFLPFQVDFRSCRLNQVIHFSHYSRGKMKRRWRRRRLSFGSKYVHNEILSLNIL